jgi:hypothetical protein
MLTNCVSNISPSLALESEFTTALCELIDTPRSLTVAMLIRYGEWEQYLDLSIDPSHYVGPGNFADNYLVTEILRKSPSIPLPTDRREQALEAFWVSELCCFVTNQRLRSEPFSLEHALRREIAHVLGPLDRKALSSIDELMRHGPGATASLKGRGLVPSDKFDKQLSLTIDLYPYYKALLGENWHDANRTPAKVVGGNKFTTVPKNARTDRGICAEPTLNMYVQLGIGSYLKRRLKRFGIDLHDQTLNQRLAQRAWKDGLATIDLSMASDTLASDVVLRFFPPDWVELLCLPRSHRCNIDGDWHELEKFSSMGNGYTFEIESLLFFSVIKCIVPKEEMCNVGVYGDDLICPQKYAPVVVDVLKFLGFRTNVKKSFLAGSFFESCGSDWFEGHNVRPFYLKARGENSIPYPVQICNALRLYSKRRAYDIGCDSRYKALWESMFAKVPWFWSRCKVPLALGDSGVICSREEAKPEKPRGQLTGVVTRHIVMKPDDIKKRAYKAWLLTVLPREAPLRKHKAYDYTRRDTVLLRARLLKDLEHDLDGKVSSRGREPRRGLLRMVLSKKAVIYEWPDSLDWI